MIPLGTPLPCILERISAFPKDVMIAIEGAHALRQHARNGAIIKAGGHVQLLKAIAAFPDSKKLCEHASEALWQISGEGEPQRSALVAAGAIPLLAAIVRTHEGRAKFYSEATLKYLGLRSDGTK